VGSNNRDNAKERPRYAAMNTERIRLSLSHLQGKQWSSFKTLAGKLEKCFLTLCEHFHDIMAVCIFKTVTNSELTHTEKTNTMISTKSLSRGQVKQKGNLEALYSLPLDLTSRSLFATDSVGTPPRHHSPFLHSVSCFSSQLSFFCLHTHPRTNHDNGRLTGTVAFSRPFYLCLADKTALLNASSIKTHATSHAHQLGQLTNVRTD